MIEAEGPVPQGLCDVGDAVLAQDVEGETAGAGHDSGVVADATAVLVAGNIPDVMVPILDAPMSADGGGPCGRRESGGRRNVVGDLTAFGPHAGGGSAEQGAAGDADDGFDERLPLGFGEGVPCGEDLDGAVLLARAPLAAVEDGFGGFGVCRQGADGLKQGGLVFLDLDQQVVARGPRRLECFFGRAWRPG